MCICMFGSRLSSESNEISYKCQMADSVYRLQCEIAAKFWHVSEDLKQITF